jgi:SOS-response transcriptional repressor LexA
MYRCRVCPATFSTSHALGGHMHAHNPSRRREDATARLLLCVERTYRLHGRAPVVAEMSEASGVTSKNTLYSRLRDLEAAGLIAMDTDENRKGTIRPLVRAVPWSVSP